MPTDNAEMTAALRKEIDGLRKPFAGFASDFAKLSETRGELAPKFWKVFGNYTAQVGGSFVDFVRVLDPTVPSDRAAYRAHRAYQAADYLRRLVSRRDTGGRATRPVRSNVTIMARLLATLIPLVKDQESLWQGLGAELGLRPRQLTRLRNEVATVRPIVEINAKPVETLKVIHMPTPQEIEARQAQKSQRRRVAA